MPYAPDVDIIQSLRFEYYRTLLIETAGVFWILAEYWILFAARAGLRSLSGTQAGAGVINIRRLVGTSFLLVCVFATILGRHFAETPFYVQLGQMAGSSDEASLQRAVEGYVSSQRLHFAVWASFVTVWVVLEALIVYNGWRGYARLCEVLSAGGKLGLPAVARCFFLVFCAVGAVSVPMGFVHAAALTDDAILRTIGDAHAANVLYSNALGLYLRLAGAVWVAVEWVAALVLWKSYRMIARVVRKEAAP